MQQPPYKRLTPRRREMMQMYHVEKKTLEEIGKHFGITRERVRQIIKSSENFKKEIIKE
jgi:RNA polymerase sigma factor (sigma-70 family)